MMARVLIVVSILSWATSVSGATQQSPLEAARDLYAAAAFEEALDALARVPADATTPPDRARQAQEYRMFTLFALGRRGDAEAVALTLVQADPLARLNSPDASPRIRAMYDEVRARILPQLVRDRYRSGRAALEAKTYAAASEHLLDAQKLLDEARAAGSVDSGLDDLRELIGGFLLLASTRPAEPPASRSEPAPALAAPTPANVTAPTASAPSAAAPRMYSAADVDVTPPGALLQTIPTLPPPLRVYSQPGSRPLIVNLAIDESGRVKQSTVIVSVNPAYDAFMLNVVSQWRYRPAMKGAVAVPYEKVVAIK